MVFLSQKNIQRFLFGALFVTILIIKVYFLLLYAAVFYLSYEYLNSNKSYLANTRQTFYNWLFIFFLLFVVLVRSKWFFNSPNMNYNLNIAEHFFFAFIVCLTLSIYFQILTYKNIRLKSLLLIVLVFNIIGLLNECFQNFFQSKALFILEQEDLKDIVVNIGGSVLYFQLALISKKKI